MPTKTENCFSECETRKFARLCSAEQSINTPKFSPGATHGNFHGYVLPMAHGNGNVLAFLTGIGMGMIFQEWAKKRDINVTEISRIEVFTHTAILLLHLVSF